MEKIKILLMMGGGGSEHQVSLDSAKEVKKHFDLNKYEIIEMLLKEEKVDIDEVKRINPDLVFIVIHGSFGEDGRLQKLLENNGIKFIGCGSESSKIGIDKVKFKKIIDEAGLPVASGVLIKKGEEINFDEIKILGNKLVVKPNREGSSVGISLVEDIKDLEKAINLAFKYDDEVLIERFIEGKEVSCGVLGNDNPIALPVIEICPKNNFFDYEAKYKKGRCEEIVPARLSDEITNKIQEYTLNIFELIKGRGLARVDFIIEKGEPVVLEINTIPGLTENSLLPKEAKAGGMSYGHLLDRIIELALED